MERNRDLKRSNISAVNGLSKRRQRISTLRDTSEDGQVELPETVRLGDRERVQKKDRDRDFLKKRRTDRSVMQHKSGDGVGETSKENQSTDSSDEEYFEEDEETKVHQRNRMNLSCPPSSSLSNNRRCLRTLRSSPVFRAAADDIIGVPVPRRARSASAKRLHGYCNSGSGVLGEDFSHRGFSPSVLTANQIGSGSSSLSSFNDPTEKKMKSAQPRLQDFSNGSNSRPSSVIGDDIEIEVAEALFDLMKQTQSQPHSSKKDEMVDRDCKKADDDVLKRLNADGDKDGNNAFSVQNEPPITVNAVVDDSAEKLNKEGSLRKKFPGHPDQELVSGDRLVNKVKVGTSKEREPQSGPEENTCEFQDPTKRKADDATIVVDNEVVKLQIDLMAPPPLPSSSERDALADTVTNSKVANQDVQKKGEIISENGGPIGYAVGPQGGKIRGISINQLPKLDLEKSRTATTTVSDHGTQQCWGQEQKNLASTSSLPCPVGMRGWPGVISHPGYVPHLQAVLPVGLSARSSTPMQPPQFKFSEPRPKRYATHQYIAHNIQRHQQLVNEYAFSGPTAAATLYGTNPMILKSTQQYITGSQLQSLATISDASATDKSSEIAAAFNSATNTKPLLPQAPIQASTYDFLHGSALIFPSGHHQTTVIGPAQSASVLSNSSNSAGRPSLNFSFPGGPVATSFNHSNSPSYEASPYMAILQNGCPIPFTKNIPMPNLKGGSPSQTMPFSNSSVYPSPVYNVSQKQQNLCLPHAPVQSTSQNASTSNGSSSHRQPLGQPHITTKIGENKLPNPATPEGKRLKSDPEIFRKSCVTVADGLVSHCLKPMNSHTTSFPVQAMNLAMIPPGMMSGGAVGNKLSDLQEQGSSGRVDLIPQAFGLSFGSSASLTSGDQSLEFSKSVSTDLPAISGMGTSKFDGLPRTVNFLPSSLARNQTLPSSPSAPTSSVSVAIPNFKHQQQLIQLQKQHVQLTGTSQLKSSIPSTVPGSFLSDSFPNNTPVLTQLPVKSDSSTLVNILQGKYSQSHTHVTFGSSSASAVAASFQGQQINGSSVRTASSAAKAGPTVSTLPHQDMEASPNGPSQNSSPACRRNISPILSSYPGQLSELKY